MSDKIGVEHFFARLSDMLLLFIYFPVTRHGKHIAMLVFIAHFAESRKPQFQQRHHQHQSSLVIWHQWSGYCFQRN